jgi:hypothetical protein
VTSATSSGSTHVVPARTGTFSANGERGTTSGSKRRSSSSMVASSKPVPTFAA